MNSFVQWWQSLPSQMNPYILQIGGFRLGWYGVMYLVAFAISWIFASYRIKKKESEITTEQLSGFFSSTILGVILGGRIGYILFYNLGYYLNHPLEIILPFDIANGWKFIGISGMSFHGGFLGVFISSIIYSWRNKVNYRDCVDLLLPGIPLGYTFGRIGNFINGELWGRTTDSSIGMIFPTAPGTLLRHPSQLYEALTEGILLWMLLWFLRNRVKTKGIMLSLFLVGYGTARFFVEYFREPDEQLGLLLFNLSMGQILSSLMIFGGVGLYFFLRKLQNRELAQALAKPSRKKKKKRTR